MADVDDDCVVKERRIFRTNDGLGKADGRRKDIDVIGISMSLNIIDFCNYYRVQRFPVVLQASIKCSFLRSRLSSILLAVLAVKGLALGGIVVIETGLGAGFSPTHHSPRRIHILCAKFISPVPT